MVIKVNLSRGDDPIKQIEESLRAISKIKETFAKRKEFTLDFSEVNWILPCSAILLSSKLNEVSIQGAKINYIESKNKQVQEYLSKIGFPLGSEEEGDTFIPISHFQDNPSKKNQVEEEALTLFEKISSKIPPIFGRNSIPHILSELSDNIDQHSEFTFASLMAQFYPKKEYLDLVVLDNGVSIPFLFEKNNIKFDKDSGAIMKAVSGEISTKKEEIMRGFGLKSCKRLSLEGFKGELHIISRKGAILFESNKTPKVYNFDNETLEGTLLYFRLPVPKGKVPFYSLIKN